MRLLSSSNLPGALLLGAVTFAAAGCAPVETGAGPNDPTQEISVDTPGAPGATCTLRSVVIGTQVIKTPAKIRVDRSSEHITALCRKECYLDASSLIESHPDPSAARRLAGKLKESGSELADETSRYTTENHVKMVPVPGCQPRA